MQRAIKLLAMPLGGKECSNVLNWISSYNVLRYLFNYSQIGGL
jgi:hypothetical protein